MAAASEIRVDTNDNGEKEATAEHKTRRPHRKSRYGCTKCKERRVKCDELSPRCSRCQKTNLVCHYPKRQPPNLLAASDDYWLEPIDPLLLGLDFSARSGSASSPESCSGHSSTAFASSSSRSPLSSISSSIVTLPTHHGSRRLDSPLRSQVAQTLAPAEFELLKHYLEHSCKDLTVDSEDQYTLQIGIPNLACQSKPLMRSVLAVAAVCKCCDIINQPSVSLEDRDQVLEYLTLADQYHMQSLREIQASLPDSKHYDFVLANAAVMGIYGSGSHRTRIWLTKTAAFGEQSLYDLMPKQLQWMSLWRAVDLAYLGILNESSSSSSLPDDMSHHQRNSPTTRSPPDLMSNLQYEYKVTSRVERPRTPMTNHPLYPILAATSASALSKLRETARETALISASTTTPDHLSLANLYDPSTTPSPAYTPDPALQSCFAALSIFATVLSETFPTNGPPASSPPSQLTFEVDIDPAGRLSEVSPWIRRYAARVTAMIPSKLPRRVIPGFIHKVPTAYLTLVTEMISYINTGTPPPPPPSSPTPPPPNQDLNLDIDLDIPMSWPPPTTPSSPLPSPSPTPSLAHQLALEIFTYWLVLMILLDNVWWIGDVGAWELGRIVNFRKSVQQQQQQQDNLNGGGGSSSSSSSMMYYIWSKQEDWWPESMYEVSQQFDKHRG